MTRNTQQCMIAAALTLLAIDTPAARAGVNQITGVTVPQLTAIDSAVVGYMNANNVDAAVVGVSVNGCIVYQRGFGFDLTPSAIIPENMPMRLASVEKPLTASVIWDLVNDNVISANDPVFDIPGLNVGGLLPAATYFPYQGLGDTRLANITVMDLLQHRGGFSVCDMTLGDPQFATIEIADELDVPSPPGRVQMVRYMMSQPLSYMPGTPTCNGAPGNCSDAGSCTGTGCYCGYSYSNFGYMLLGLIIEEVTGDDVATHVRERILTPDQWVPSTEVFRGATFASSHDPREPVYVDGAMWPNVFDPDGDDVPAPYGGWDHGAFQGHGNLVASAAPLLKFLDAYIVIGNFIGAPQSTITLTGDIAHSGGMPGTSTVARQSNDGINIVVLCNRRNGDAAVGAAQAVRVAINGLLAQPGFTWPTFCVDGSWVNFIQPASGHGGFSDPFVTMTALLNNTTDGTRVHFQPGATPWTGEVSTKMLWDAPYGNVVIGQ